MIELSSEVQKCSKVFKDAIMEYTCSQEFLIAVEEVSCLTDNNNELEIIVSDAKGVGKRHKPMFMATYGIYSERELDFPLGVYDAIFLFSYPKYDKVEGISGELRE